MERESHESFIRKRFGVCLSGIAVVLLAIAILLAPNLPLTSTVYACSEPPGGFPVYTVAERTDAADLVLEGTVIEVTGDVNQMEAKVAVERYFKDRGYLFNK